MALRFTDTTKWQDEWWQSLSNDYRIIYQYLQDHCNIAGIIRREYRLMNFQCGTNITPQEFARVFNGRVIEIPNTDYWLLRNFCKNQYPKGLASDKPMIKGVRQLAEKFNVLHIINESYTNHSLMISQSLPNDIGNGKGKGKGKREKGKGNTEGEAKKFDLKPYATVYDEWMRQHSGVGAKITPAGMKAMKDIAVYLRRQVQDKHPEYDEDMTESETLRAWQWVFANFDRWDNFHKGQLKLEQINSNLINIITSIKNPKTHGKQHHDDLTNLKRDIASTLSGHS